MGIDDITKPLASRGYRAYSAYVPEIPTILVTGRSQDELAARDKEAIRIYWENLAIDRSATSTLREIEVELPA